MQEKAKMQLHAQLQKSCKNKQKFLFNLKIHAKKEQKTFSIAKFILDYFAFILPVPFLHFQSQNSCKK